MQKPLQILKNDKGVALLITLTFIALAVAGTVELNRRVRSSVMHTGVVKDGFVLSSMANSAINAAMVLLAKDKSESREDSLLEDWADPEKISLLLNMMKFDRGQVSTEITDELSRIQINALVKYPYTRHFNDIQKRIWLDVLNYAKSVDDSLADIEPVSLVNCAKDWLDFGDDDAVTGLTGAESQYYEDLDTPYLCANGLFRDISQLALVKGFSKELVFGKNGIPGLSEYMTVFGISEAGGGFTYKGKININTASLPVIAAILPMERKSAAQIICDFRETLIEKKDKAAFLKTDWYKNAPGCKDLTIEPTVLCISSDIFRIKAQAKLDKMQYTVIAIVSREKDKNGTWKCRILSRKVI